MQGGYKKHCKSQSRARQSILSLTRADFSLSGIAPVQHLVIARSSRGREKIRTSNERYLSYREVEAFDEVVYGGGEWPDLWRYFGFDLFALCHPVSCLKRED
jgi:hypothetical protein